jgi:hypothetical protein
MHYQERLESWIGEAIQLSIKYRAWNKRAKFYIPTIQTLKYILYLHLI